MTLTRDQILESNDLKNEEVDVPEWNGKVLVRTMTGADRESFEASLMTIGADGARKPEMSKMRAKLVAMTVVDADGNLLFTPADVDLLARKSAAALDRVFDVAQAINGMGAQAEAKAEKNSEAAQSGASTSA